jgi:hypothetical protein
MQLSYVKPLCLKKKWKQAKKVKPWELQWIWTLKDSQMKFEEWRFWCTWWNEICRMKYFDALG